ncbi:MAG: glycerol-3-phosphate acyltransferase [Symbiopectobacterium sp.]
MGSDWYDDRHLAAYTTQYCLISGYSSLVAIGSALIAPFYMWWFKPQFTFPMDMLSCLILMRHHDNIQRLWRGQESKICKRRNKDETLRTMTLTKRH